MNQIELGYVAGLIDGEGCIWARETKTGNIDVAVKVTSTDLDIVEKMFNFTGVGKIHGPYNNPEKKKPYWSWDLQRMREIREILSQVRPMMSLRRQKSIDEVLEVINTKLDRIIICPVCETQFHPMAHNSRFCDAKCRRSWNYHKGKKGPNPRIQPFCCRCRIVEKQSGAYCRQCKQDLYYEKKEQRLVAAANDLLRLMDALTDSGGSSNTELEIVNRNGIK